MQCGGQAIINPSLFSHTSSLRINSFSVNIYIYRDSLVFFLVSMARKKTLCTLRMTSLELVLFDLKCMPRKNTCSSLEPLSCEGTDYQLCRFISHLFLPWNCCHLQLLSVRFGSALNFLSICPIYAWIKIFFLGIL